MKGEVIPSDYSEVYDLFNVEYFSPQSVADALNEADGDDVTLEINSPGGYVDAPSSWNTQAM